MKIKIGKAKNCVKKLVRYGFSKAQAEIICGNIAIKDTDWEVKRREEEVSEFETEVTGEDLHVTAAKKKKKLKTTAAGGKAVRKEKGKERPAMSEPRAMQLPLFQPWRAFKSEHRLQTKMEKIITAEEKFLTMEQLMKRAEYALAIKKKDAAPFVVYAIPEEVWDQAIGMGKPLGTTKKGYPIVSWIKKGGQSIPMVMTEKGAMTEAEAIKSGAAAGGGGVGGGPTIKSILGERAERRMEAKGRIPIEVGRTLREKQEFEGLARDKALGIGLKELEKTTFEIKSPYERLKKIAERREREEAALEKPIQTISQKQTEERATLDVEIRKIEESPSFKTLGADLETQIIQWKDLPQEDLWSHIYEDLHWMVEGKNSEYDHIYMTIGKKPYEHHSNPLNQYEAISNMKRTEGEMNTELVLHDFIVHSKNYYLKEHAHDQLKKINKHYYNKEIAPKMKGTQATPRTKQRYGYGPESGGTAKQGLDYERQKHEFGLRELERGLYNAQRDPIRFSEDMPTKDIKRLLEEERQRETDKGYKAQPPSSVLEELGLLQENRLITTPKYEEEEMLPETKEYYEKLKTLEKIQK